MRKHITVAEYNPEWPYIFEKEAAFIKEALGDNCIALHHIGSTSVPGLCAKPIIDMIAVLKDPETAIIELEKLGLKYKGEYNIPMRYYFSRDEGVAINLHAYAEGHPEIELNLVFRDYLRDHKEAREEYAALKKQLLKDPSSFEKKNSAFTGYNLGKDSCIRKILQLAQFDRVRLVKCSHHAEWDRVKYLRNRYFFDPLKIEDPYTSTFNHPEHHHFILYKGVEIVGYAQIQFWPEKRATLRILVIDAPYQSRGYGTQLLQLCEQWLKKMGIRSLHDEARKEAVAFYRKNGYTEMVFNDPSGDPPSPYDIAMGKLLS